MPTTIIRYSREERAERRKQLADDVKERGDVSETARKFNVSRDLVMSACRTYKVPYKKPNIPQIQTYEIIALIILDNPSNEEIGKRYGLTRQRVHTIRTNMRKAGLPFGIRGVLNSSRAKSKLKGMV